MSDIAVVVKYNGLEPIKMTTDSAGYDLRMPKDVVVHPGNPVKIQLNFKMEMPAGLFGYIVPRSSFGLKGLLISGVIDSDYRDYIYVVLHSLLPIKIQKK